MKHNFVAKHAHKFNKCVRHRDRKNDYKRHPKHKGNVVDTMGR